MDWLANSRIRFQPNAQQANFQLASEAMQAATSSHHNPGASNVAYEAEGGSATGVFCCFQRITRTTSIMHAGSIGDSALIVVHLRQSLAEQLNPVHRKHPKDTGGQLTMCIGIDGPVWVFSREVTSDELIILSTDGLTDNVHLPELDRIIPLLISARVFDTIVPFACEELAIRKPSLAYLREVTKALGVEPLTTVSCRMASVRLFNYVEWVTRDFFTKEEVYYDLCLQMNKLQREPSTPDTERELGELRTQAETMSAQRKQVAQTAKTDDAMMLVLRPFNTM